MQFLLGGPKMKPNKMPIEKLFPNLKSIFNMKKKLILILLLFSFKAVTAQTTEFTSGLLNLTKQINEAITDTTIIKIAVWDFTDLEGKVNTLGKYISEESTINFVNVGKRYDIMNRNHLAQILKEHKLNSEGLIDNNTAKELGKLAAVDAIVTGTVTVLNDKIKVTMQVLNTETARTIAAGKVECSMNEDIKILLGMTSYDNSGQKIATNPELVPGANEIYNDDKLVSADCSTRKTGDYCFYNATKFNMTIYFKNDGGSLQTINSQGIVKAGETKCFYSQLARRYIFVIHYNPADPAFESWRTDYQNEPCGGCKVFKEGAFFVEQCKSKTYTIK